ncbi:hypothetical protein H6F86_20870 [Phormidium sp. FACHB-592]|uniref:Uncharacterized protein n=1 Tax=Stenomitos frigidus AS-A4 TaxID=2933935 RepID=A0ABV0KF29_9CYAN|nr:hypothetical protein [Phormidium sp. FACHB-592]MBD2076287.1 hypothetical protein [Phormidium sp. FACHB-592]
MLRGLFGGKKEEYSGSSAFGTVLFTPWAAEYRGEIPATTGVTHNLFAAAITPEAAKALLGEGFRPINGAIPTHTIKCTTALARDSYQPRALFDLFIDLSAFPASWGLWIAVQTCKRLKRRLFTCTEKALLIRCKTENEFPFCCDDQTLDIAWLDDGNRCLGLAIAEYKKMTNTE